VTLKFQSCADLHSLLLARLGRREIVDGRRVSIRIALFKMSNDEHDPQEEEVRIGSIA
jgi:hypothetical protein